MDVGAALRIAERLPRRVRLRGAQPLGRAPPGLASLHVSGSPTPIGWTEWAVLGVASIWAIINTSLMVAEANQLSRKRALLATLLPYALLTTILGVLLVLVALYATGAGSFSLEG